MFAFDRYKGPTKDDKDDLVHHIEKGCMYGGSLDVLPKNLKEAHHYNDPVEPIYYETQDTRGGQIVTTDIFAVRYGPDDLATKQ